VEDGPRVTGGGTTRWAGLHNATATCAMPLLAIIIAELSPAAIAPPDKKDPRSGAEHGSPSGKLGRPAFFSWLGLRVPLLAAGRSGTERDSARDGRGQPPQFTRLAFLFCLESASAGFATGRGTCRLCGENPRALPEI